ncbi:WD40 repeat domain-containing protein [Streptosporangium sp. NPDC000396]|uniref:WD40 repeat domain-containing protein n=1 Tax=Streptosporangium sp. NPDC000396 TaxID=3366185 RepID=UPI0036C8E36A
MNGRPIAVSAGAEGTVRFWKLPGFQPAAEPLNGTSAMFVELGDGPGVLTKGEYGARLWDLSTRKVVKRFLENTVFTLGDYGGVRALFASDGETVRVWNPATRALMRTLRTSGAYAMAVGRLRGRQILVAYEGEDSPLRIWDLASGRKIGREFYMDDEYATPEWMTIAEIGGRTLLLARSYLGIHQWDLAAQKDMGMLVSGNLESREDDNEDQEDYSTSALTTDRGRQVLALGQFTSDHQSLTKSVPASTFLWDPVRGRRLGTLKGHQGAVTALASGTLDGKPVLLSGSRDNTIRLWDVRARRQIGDPSPAGPIDGAEAAAFATIDGRPIVVTGEENGTVRTWDPATRRPAGKPMRGAPTSDLGGLTSLAATDLDGDPVAVIGRWPTDIRVWNLKTSTLLETLPVPSKPGDDGGLWQLVTVRQAAGPLVVATVGTAGGPRTFTWDLRTRRLTARFDLDPRGENWISDTLVSLVDGQAYVVAYNGGYRSHRLSRRVEIWDATGRRISAFTVSPLSGEKPDEEFQVYHMGRFGCRVAVLATSGSDSVRVLDPATGRDLTPPIDLGGEGSASARLLGVAEMGGHTIALTEVGVDDSRTSRVWDLTTRKPLSAPMKEVYWRAFAAGAPYLVSAGPEEQLLLWRLANAP